LCSGRAAKPGVGPCKVQPRGRRKRHGHQPGQHRVGASVFEGHRRGWPVSVANVWRASTEGPLRAAQGSSLSRGLLSVSVGQSATAGPADQLIGAPYDDRERGDDDQLRGAERCRAEDVLQRRLCVEACPVSAGGRRRALGVALGLADPGPRSPEPGLVGLAVADVLRLMAAPGRLLMAIDDIQWVDRASADALTVAIRRLIAEPVGPRARPPDAAGDGDALVSCGQWRLRAVAGVRPAGTGPRRRGWSHGRGARPAAARAAGRHPSTAATGAGPRGHATAAHSWPSR